MASNNNIATFLIGPHALLSLLFSLAAMVSMNVSAAYTDCTPSPLSGITTDCFSLSVQPQTTSLSSTESPYDVAFITANSAITVPEKPEHSLAAPTSQGGGFYVNQNDPRGEQLPESLPLVLLIATLLAIFLMRAKSLNNK